MSEPRRAAIRSAITQGEPLRALRLHKLIDTSFASTMKPIPWAEAGYMLPDPPEADGIPLGKHPLHAAGAYYLQEPSAMAPVRALDVQPGLRVLDLCAAPGGKSGQIIAALRGRGVLVANEPRLDRARELRGNLARLGAVNAIITQETPERLAECFPEWFDLALVDAPCSGEGMFRRSASARRDWNLRAVNGCAARQRAILESARSMLRPGGAMVYSTCTFNHIENETTVRLFLDDHPEFVVEDFSLSGLPPSESGMLLITPDSGLGEGQFMARVRKTGANRGARPRLSGRTRTVPDAERAAFESFREDVIPGFNPSGSVYRLGGRLTALPADCTDPERWSALRVLAAGVDLGAARPHGWEPSYALGMALTLESANRVVPLDETEALAWINGHDAPLVEPFGGASRWAIAAYKNLPLGFGKASDGRLKNRRLG